MYYSNGNNQVLPLFVRVYVVNKTTLSHTHDTDFDLLLLLLLLLLLATNKRAQNVYFQPHNQYYVNQKRLI